jgi:hypothetical protein
MTKPFRNKFQNGVVEVLMPGYELFNRPADHPLQTGIPVRGVLVFEYPGQHVSNFSGVVKYTLMIHDSFGDKYVASTTTHGEYVEPLIAPPMTPPPSPNPTSSSNKNTR